MASTGRWRAGTDNASKLDQPGRSTLEERYLEAYRTNVSARQGLDELRQQDGNAAPGVREQVTLGSKAGSYLQLIRQRRRHEEYQVLHRHVEKLSKTPAAHPHFLDIRVSLSDAEGSQPGHTANSFGSLDGQPETLADLSDRLERAVLQAKHRLEHERRLLEQIKIEHHQQPETPTRIQRLQGLTAVQTELFSWVEEKLASSPEMDTNEVGGAQSKLQVHDLDSTEADNTDVKSQYDLYLKARQRLLHAVAVLSHTLDKNGSLTTTKASTSPERGPYDTELPVSVFLEQRLVPLYDAHQAAKMRQSLLSAMINESYTQTLQELDRLADESHLLSSYPLSSHSGRQVNITRASSQADRPRPAKTDNEPDEIGQKIQAWTFASEAASKSTSSFVSEQLQRGMESLDQADVNISKLQELTGDTPESAHDVEDEEDIWTGDIKVDHRTSQRGRKAARSASPWTRLNGRIGLDEKSANG